MRKQQLFGFLAVVLLNAFSPSGNTAPIGSAFTYQGRLTDNANPANGGYDLRFGLWTTASGSGQIGGYVTQTNVAVSNGYFTVTLDFGAGVFNGTACWLELEARTNGAGAFTTLAPRQPVNPTPYALYAVAAPLADSAVTSAKILDNSVMTADMAGGSVTSNVLADNSVTSPKIVDGAVGLNDLGSNSVNSTKILDGSIATADFASGVVTSNVLADNSVTSAKIVDGAVTANDLAADAVNSSKISDGSIATADLALGAVNSSKILDGSITGTDLADNTVTSSELADSIDLGSTAVSGTLNVYRTTANTPAISLFGAVSQLSIYGSDGLEQVRLGGTSSGALTLHNSGVGNEQAVLLTANGSLGAYLSLNASDGTAHAILSGANTGSYLSLYQADGQMGLHLDGDSSGSGLVSVRSTNGTATAELAGQASTTTGGRLRLKQTDGTIGATLEGEETSGRGGRLLLHNSTGSVRAEIDGDYGDNAGAVNLYTADGSSGLLLEGDNGGAGYVSIRNTNSVPRVGLDGYSTAGGGEISVYDTDGTETVEILGAESGTEGGQILLKDADGTMTIQLDGDVGGTGGGYLRLYKGDGTATITLQADLNGDGRITTQELMITGGSDLSEQFDINAVSSPPHPGMVVCIDPANPGQLLTSTRAYDRTVAGVISGAGGVKPGMLMGQRGTQADGKHPVALTGRVYCLADAANGAIQPGDLLTTSATPGHAMKVTDHQRAQGAIIGKAMTSLEKGKGLVLVLVSLQ